MISPVSFNVVNNKRNFAQSQCFGSKEKEHKKNNGRVALEVLSGLAIFGAIEHFLIKALDKREDVLLHDPTSEFDDKFFKDLEFFQMDGIDTFQKELDEPKKGLIPDIGAQEIKREAKSVVKKLIKNVK